MRRSSINSSTSNTVAGGRCERPVHAREVGSIGSIENRIPARVNASGSLSITCCASSRVAKMAASARSPSERKPRWFTAEIQPMRPASFALMAKFMGKEAHNSGACGCKKPWINRGFPSGGPLYVLPRARLPANRTRRHHKSRCNLRLRRVGRAVKKNPPVFAVAEIPRTAYTSGLEYPQRDLNPRHGTENPGSWAARRWGPVHVLYRITSKESTIASGVAPVTIEPCGGHVEPADRRFK